AIAARQASERYFSEKIEKQLSWLNAAVFVTVTVDPMKGAKSAATQPAGVAESGVSEDFGKVRLASVRVPRSYFV
ncbi:hypothetical protein ACQ7B2_01450, partial [Escherichia coli]